MKTIDFKTIRDSFFQDGYVHIKGALSIDGVNETRQRIDACFANFQEIAKTYTKIHASGSKESKEIMEINHLLKLIPPLRKSETSSECRSISSELLLRKTYHSFDHAIYKAPGGGEISWHQDQAYKARVKRMQSIHFWIPLHDVPESLGGMQYVEGSHLGDILPHCKHTGNQTLSVHPQHITQSKIVAFPVEIGDVIIHHPRTLHGSRPNLSETIRKAWILHFSPYGRFEPLLPTNLMHYMKNRIMQ